MRSFLAENGGSVLAGRTLLPVIPEARDLGLVLMPGRFIFQDKDMHHGLDLRELLPRWSLAAGSCVSPRRSRMNYGEFLHVLAAGDRSQTTPELLEGWKLLEGRGIAGGG